MGRSRGFGWGLIATGIMALLSPFVARFLRIESPYPLWAASFALLLLFLRPVTDGTLQGVQNFFGLGAVQMLQSSLRLIFAVAFIGFGWRATGAILALPFGSAIALGLALLLLRVYFRAPAPAETSRSISWRYSVVTLVGLLAIRQHGRPQWRRSAQGCSHLCAPQRVPAHARVRRKS